MKFSLAISPCPNDTFIFDELIHKNSQFEFNIELRDVEVLNQWALERKCDILKVSFATYLQVKDHYTLLRSGSALGHGVGPLLVSKNPVKTTSWHHITEMVNNCTIAIPGQYTTAHLLLSSAFPDALQKKQMIFSEIEHAVLSGEVDMGLLIHEGRFTYKDKGLHLVQDMGSWWEHTHGLPIPLGCIIMKNELCDQYKYEMELAIQSSIQHSWNQYPVLSNFIQQNAQEMSDDVMRSHIELYVNEESKLLSDKGVEAILKLESVFKSLNNTQYDK